MIVDSFLRLKYDEISKREAEKIRKQLTYATPQNEVVTVYRDLFYKGYMKLPRGAWNFVPDHVSYFDRRSKPKQPVFDFTVKLDDIEKDPRFEGQERAVAAMLREEQGLVIRPPGTGKTQIALAFAARVGTPTLVIVHTEDILQQWLEYAERAIPELAGRIGVIRGKHETFGPLTIGTVQTLRKMVVERDARYWKKFGAVILDEAHHASAPTFEAVMNLMPAHYRFGFTASPTRADGLHPSMKFIIGPIIHRKKFSSTVKLRVIPVKTKFRFKYRGHYDWSPLLNALVTDRARNRRIAYIADREIERGNSVLILSRRIEHLELIGEAMNEDAEILTGRKNSADRKRILQEFREGKVRCLLATQLADEALDVPRLNRVILTHPGKHEGRIIQQIGRAIREHPDKRDAKIYDIVDPKIGVLKRQWNERKRTYLKNRIVIKFVGRVKW